MNNPSLQTVRTVVAATDLSKASELVVEQAALLAKRWDADLVLLHVFNDGFWASIIAIHETEHWVGADHVLIARNRLSQQARAIEERHGVRVHGETRTGSAATEIATFCREQNAQLLVVGEHGNDWIGDTVLGGTTQKVLEHIAMPVLLVRHPASTDFVNILVATDFSDSATRAAELSTTWFPKAHQQLVHAYHVAFEGCIRMAGASDAHIEQYRLDEMTRAEKRMQEQIEKLSSPVAIEKRLAHGYPAVVLQREIERSRADLIVIGKHSGTTLEEKLLGSVTRNMLYQANCNVLLVP